MTPSTAPEHRSASGDVAGRPADRLLPADDRTRAVARELYESVAAKPIISPHGHVPPALLDDDHAFRDATELFIEGDHYVTRLLHSAGVELADLGVGGASTDPRRSWRLLAEHWQIFAGTASGYWIEEELAGVFGIETPLSAGSADAVFDSINAMLSLPAFRPRSLFTRFGIEFLATTDDPLDDLSVHRRIAASGLGGQVVPTFRPDKYLDPAAAGFQDSLARLLAETSSAATFTGYLGALEERRAHFIANGAVSADHGVEEAFTLDLDPGRAEALFQQVVSGSADAQARRAFRGHMLFQMARMSVEDGLVMTIHAGISRNHSSATFDRYGSDTGHDIPVPTSFVTGLRPMLERFGLERDLHIVLFTVDETTFSREIAPLAGFYPSVFIGAPWWFLDAPDAIGRFRSAVTETAGFYRSSGFIDDTRAFLSIPARHDMARRADASFLARLVLEGRVSRRSAETVMHDLVDSIPRMVFKL